MDGRSITDRRLHNLCLLGTPLRAIEDVVGRLGAVQSQDYGPAKWSIADRAAGVSDAALDRGFADGAILRTHILRPTWHFVLPSDIRWLLALTAPRVHALNAYYYRQLGLDEGVRGKSEALLAGALRGGNQLTRKEVAGVLEQGGIDTVSLRLGYILMSAELNGVICSGPLRGKQHTYALLDDRAPQARSLVPDEALAELTLRYFASHGPATVQDYKWWSSLTVADIRRGIAMLGSRLDSEVVDGVTYWSADRADPPAAPTTVHLLQGYDESIVGYGESKHLLDAAGVAGSLPRDGVTFNSVVMLDGQVAGHWKRTVRKGSADIEVVLYAPFNDEQLRALAATASRYGEFLGLPATVTVLA
jgi:hypothetical protein